MHGKDLRRLVAEFIYTGSTKVSNTKHNCLFPHPRWMHHKRQTSRYEQKGDITSGLEESAQHIYIWQAPMKACNITMYIHSFIWSLLLKCTISLGRMWC